MLNVHMGERGDTVSPTPPQTPDYSGPWRSSWGRRTFVKARSDLVSLLHGNDWICIIKRDCWGDFFPSSLGYL